MKLGVHFDNYDNSKELRFKINTTLKRCDNSKTTFETLKLYR